MPVLPIIDLLIFLGWTTLAAGGILKAVYLATSYRPTLFSLTPIDLLLVAIAFLALAMTLAARTWVRLNEPQLVAGRRAAASLEAVSLARARDTVAASQPPGFGETALQEDGPQEMGVRNGAANPGQWRRVP